MNPPDDACGSPQPRTPEELGWTHEQEAAFAHYRGPYRAGRVSCRQKTTWEVLTEKGPLTAGISGALRNLGRFPAVGDFVVLLDQPETNVHSIVAILPRKTCFSRGAAGAEGPDQVIAANIDTVFIVTAAGNDLSARRTERYLAIAHASGARPVIVINKADLADDRPGLAGIIGPSAEGVPVITVSARTGEGMDDLRPFLEPKKTVVLIGSSGVGKSTIINRLLDRLVQDTGSTRESDDRGRHTTTVRQLFPLEGGAFIIDNPGLREVGIGTASAGMEETFPDIRNLAKGCRFSDCRHGNEPGCAVQEAVRAGTLSAARLENFHRLQKEIAFAQDKAEIGLARTERKRWKHLCGSNKAKEIKKARDW
jgi:ribosome biogenesis GTPase